MRNEFFVRNGLIINEGGATITGSLKVTEGITGSLFGSASHALTSSYALNAGAGAGFPYSGSAVITGSLFVSQSSVDFRLSSGVTASQVLISGSGVNRLIVVGSGSSQPLFSVIGSQGELFSINDSLSGSLFSVSDISGLPILEVFSDNRILMGSYQSPSLNTTVRKTLSIGNNIIYENIPTASYDSAFFKYSLKSGSNARAGEIMAIQSGSSVNFTEMVTTDFGSTTDVKLMVMVIGSNIALTGSALSGNWVMKTIVNAI